MGKPLPGSTDNPNAGRVQTSTVRVAKKDGMGTWAGLTVSVQDRGHELFHVLSTLLKRSELSGRCGNGQLP